jgi:phosphoglycerate dehydrogenase-like enzyme
MLLNPETGPVSRPHSLGRCRFDVNRARGPWRRGADAPEPWEGHPLTGPAKSQNTGESPSTRRAHRHLSTTTVWIPAATPVACRAFLPQGISVRDVPAFGDIEQAPQHADVLISGFDPARTIEVLPQLNDLRVLQTLSAGVDTLVEHVPPAVTLCDGSGVHDASVSEWVLMATLAMRRNLPEHLLAQRRATWEWASGGADLEDATVLILGYGSIGRAVERRLEPFGAHVLRVARRPRTDVHGVDELPELLPRADVVVVLLPLTAETQGMVDAGFLGAMRSGALLVNAARGPIVDTAALLEALRREHVRCALDVTDPEPLPDGHPLWSAPGALITPHIGGAVERVFERAWRFAGEQVRRYLDGAPLLNVVNNGY